MRASGDARSKKTQQKCGMAQAGITMEIFEHCVCLLCGDYLEMLDRSIEEVNEPCNSDSNGFAHKSGKEHKKHKRAVAMFYVCPFGFFLVVGYFES